MPTCFLICPIGETGSETRNNADDLRDLIIRPALEIYQFQVVRGDHRSDAGQIDVDVIRAVQESDLCVADVSLPNPNVFYEFGRRDETGKPVILLKSKGSNELPVDIATRRYIEYDLDSRHGIRDAIQQLRNFVEPLVKKGFEPVGSGASLSDIADSLKRVERKLDRLGGEGQLTGATVRLDGNLDLNGEDPQEVLRLALRQRNIPLAEKAMDQLRYSRPVHNWLDQVVEVVAGLGSIKAGDILLEHLEAFMDSSASTFKEKVEYVSYLVTNLNKTDRESSHLDLLERTTEYLLASAPADADEERVTLQNQMNRLYYGIYTNTHDGQWLDKALESLNKALAMSDNDYPFLYFNLAMTERRRNKPGDLESARRHILKCLEINGDENDPDHIEEACEIFHLLGDPQADDFLQKLADISPIKAQLLIASWKESRT